MKRNSKKIQHQGSSVGQNQPTKFLRLITRIDALPIVEKQPFLWALLINVFLTVLTYTLYSPQFNTNDDVFAMLITSGNVIATEPTEYILFSNLLIGIILKTLYAWMPLITWYGWYLIITMAASHTAILYVILRRQPGLLSILLYVLYYISCGAYMFIHLQFTMAASMAGIGGISLIIFVAFHKNSTTEQEEAVSWQRGWVEKIRTIPAITGILLLVWSSLVRFESFGLIVLCSIPLFFGHWEKKLAWRKIAYNLSMVALTVVVAGCAYWLSNQEYKRWMGDEFEFSQIYGEDWYNAKAMKRVALPLDSQKVIWKEIGGGYDYEMLVNEFFMDESLYNAKTLGHLRRRYLECEQQMLKFDWYREEIKILQNDQRKLLVTRQQQAWSSPTTITCGIIFIVFVLFSLTRLRDLWIYTSVILAIFALSMYINNLTVFRDSPTRVFYPMFAYIALLPLLVGMYRIDEVFVKLPILRMIVIFIAMICCIWLSIIPALMTYKGISDETNNNTQKLEAILENLKPDTSKLYVIWSSGFPLEYIAPFNNLNGLRSMRALWLTWCQRTPTSKKMLEQYGIVDVYRDLAVRDNISMLLSLNQIRNQQLEYTKRYIQFTKEYRNIVIRLRSRVTPLTQINKYGNNNEYRSYVEVKFELVNAGQ